MHRRANQLITKKHNEAQMAFRRGEVEASGPGPDQGNKVCANQQTQIHCTTGETLAQRANPHEKKSTRPILHMVQRL
jgi:hypothetical protein